MLLAEELEMLKEKENDSMDEGGQKDEQFEMEIDNKETGGRESSRANESSEEDDECLKCRSDPNRVEWVAGILVQGQHAKEEVCKMRNRQGIQKSSLVEEESYMTRNEFEALALLRRRVKGMRADGEMDAQHYTMWVMINGLIAKTKQAAIVALISSRIQAEER